MSAHTFDQIWQAEFAPMVSARLATATARRSEAFLDTTLTVAGEEIRQMTAEDLLMLDGFESPFVCGTDRAITPEDVAFFLWQLSPLNDGTARFRNRLRRTALLRRVATRDLEADCAAIREYCARMFADFAPPDAGEAYGTAPEPALAKPPSCYWLAPLLLSVSRDLGHLDPMSGRLLAQIPLPRLVQYRQAAQPADAPADDLASLRSRCLERLNTLNSAARAAAPVSVSSVCSVGNPSES
jgi:hypothetical protein